VSDDGQSFKFIYDGFGRLRKITDRSGTPVTKAEYWYNGLGHRIGWRYDIDSDADVEPEQLQEVL
jgi:YD repeat-containing protein